MAGLRFTKSALPSTSSSEDITTSPLTAFWMLLRLVRIRVSRLLKRISSWQSTVFIDSAHSTGYLSCANSMSKFSGSFCAMSAETTRIMSSLLEEPPPPLLPPPSVSSTLVSSALVSF